MITGSLAMWINTFSPETFDDFIGNDVIRKILANYATSKLLPNILLTGSYGTCKKSLARLTAKLYLEEDYERASIYIDGAVSRSKDIISPCGTKKSTEKYTYTGLNVLEFARQRITLKNNLKRVIIITNFEDMTIDAQNALRRIIETQASTTRFIIVSNNIEEIIEAIQSRCVVFKTTILNDAEAEQLIDRIWAKTQMPVALPDDIKQVIIILSDGDTRKIINYLQVIASLEKYNTVCFHKVFNIPPTNLLTAMLLDNQNAEKQQNTLENIDYILKQGYNYADILEILGKLIPRNKKLSPECIVQHLEILGRYYATMTPHINTVHLYSLFAEFAGLKDLKG
jgi:DNA polymerase III delta prime subunit